jgi:hypothetical protein
VSSGYVATIILIILLVAGPVIGVIIKGTLENRTRESMKREVDQKTQRESDIAYWKAVALDSDSSPVLTDVAVRYLGEIHGIFLQPEVSTDHASVVRSHVDRRILSERNRYTVVCGCQSCREMTISAHQRRRQLMRKKLSARRD